MPNPLVSICIPTYNRAAELRESLKSICGQDYAPLEILISDNCSDDETEKVCVAAAADPRVRYVRQSRNIGLYGNHNFCIEASQGELLAIFHDHDVRDHRIISKYVAFLQAHPEVGVVCSDWDLINEAGDVIGVREVPVKSVTPGLEFIGQTMRSGRSSIGIPGALIRRSALGPVRFNETGPIGFGDFVLWFEVAEHAAIGHIHERLWQWRQQRNSQSERTIESMTHDYYENLMGYCDAHLQRWPDHGVMVDRWRTDIRQYLFWALAFELGLHYRNQGQRRTRQPASPTLFEIYDYRLSPEEVRRVLEQLHMYRMGVVQTAAHSIISILVRLGITKPLAWMTYHHSSLRDILGLR